MLAIGPLATCAYLAPVNIKSQPYDESIVPIINTVAFDPVPRAGPLSDSPVAGVVIEIHEGTRWHQERTHRGPAQMVEPARRAMLASMLTATPQLREPIFNVQVQVPEVIADRVIGALKQA